MTSELDHRLKNALMRVVAMVERTRGAANVDDAIDKIAAQLRSMGRTHSRLSHMRWSSVALKSILEGEP